MTTTQLHLTAVPDHSDGQLRVTGERRGTAVLLRAGGSVDAANVATWRTLLCHAASAASTPGPLIIDACDLEFMGCCAYAALAEESLRCRARGIKLCLVSDRPITARVLAAADLRAELALYPSVDAALDDEGHPCAAIAAT